MNYFLRKALSITPVLLFAMFLVSCGSGIPETVVEKEKTPFQRYIGKFKVLSLPLKLDEKIIEGEGHPEYKNIEEEDTIFGHDPSYLYYGLLQDTSNFFAVIVLGVGDELSPILTTFDKTGKKISEESLNLGLCAGGGPGFDDCVASGVINKDFSIHFADSVCISEFDTARIPGTRRLDTEFQDGKIERNGRIQVAMRYVRRYLDVSVKSFDQYSPFKIVYQDKRSTKENETLSKSCQDWTIQKEQLIKIICDSKPSSDAAWKDGFRDESCEMYGVLKQGEAFFSFEVNPGEGIKVSGKNESWYFLSVKDEYKKSFLQN